MGVASLGLLRELIVADNCPSLTIALQTKSSLKVLVLKAAPGRVRLSIELNRFPTSRTLNFLDEPGAEAGQVENMGAAELLATLDIAQADTALINGGSVLSRCCNIL